MKKQLLILPLLIILMTPFVSAQSSPVTLIQSTANKVVAALKQNQSRLKSNPSIAYGIVSRNLIPHVDRISMARSVLGRKVWTSITAHQKRRFTQELTTMVVRTYSKALTKYSNETVLVHPLRGGYAGKSRVYVKSFIKRKGAPSIMLNYRLVRYGNTWKIYDMSVEGVSLLRSYRSQFSRELAQGSFDKLLSTMARRNARR